MEKEKTSLKLILSILAVLIVTLVATAAGTISAYVSCHNYANAMESAITASDTHAQNVLGQYGPRIKEALGVTNLQADAVVKIIAASNSTRYGKDGSSATVQWIKEQNPSLDQQGYARVIDLIESGRRDFQVAQDRKTDQIRAYRTALGRLPGSFFYQLAGYPTAGFFDKYDKIVISDHAAEAFRMGRDNGLDLGDKPN